MCDLVVQCRETSRKYFLGQKDEPRNFDMIILKLIATIPWAKGTDVQKLFKALVPSDLKLISNFGQRRP